MNPPYLADYTNPAGLPTELQRPDRLQEIRTGGLDIIPAPSRSLPRIT